KTLRAAHNEFETFTNSNYTHPDSRAHTLSNLVGKPSLEDLTGLQYLDLSYNLLKDSVHLYRNTQLKRLDVSHNQILGPLPTTEDELTAMIDKKLKAALKYGKTYNGGAVGKSVELTDAIRTALTKEDHYRNETRYADFRPCDLRDTTGIFHLDLTYNPKLEYIDISYTNIHNTAAGREYMNPGWETNEGEDSWYSWVDTPAPNQNYGTVKHHFIWMQPAGANLRVFKCDHNNMQSLGTVYYANLDTLSASHMYGDCLFMAGHAGDHIGWGSKEFNNGNCRNARYIDFSYGNYYSFTPTNLTNVEKLILTGNPLGGGHYPDYVLDVTHNSKLQQLQADQCTDLQTIEAHSLNDLTILDVTGNTALKTLRAYDDPVLYNAQTDFITGLFGCSNLEELWVSNDNLPVLDVAYNTKLKTLKCYDNARLPELNLDKNTALSYLDFHNCKLNNIDLRQNKALTYLDCSSEAVATNIHEDGKNKLSDLDIPADAPIQTVIANCNNLYRMTGLNKQSLTRLEFEHNHINGIDLSKTGLNNSTLKDADNGRTIAADYTIVTVKDANNNATHYDLYYFQLDSLKTSQNEVFLGGKHSVDMLKQNVLDNQGYRDDLNYEGLVSTKITAWTANATPIVGHRPNTYANAYIDPSNVNSLIDTDKISGTIVVLDEHNKRAEYTYDTGVSGHTSTYYLDWTAPDTPTAVADIETDAKPTATGGNGIISVTAPDGTAVMVYDMAGRLVQQATATGGEVVIDGMSPGVYIVNGEKVIVK
ncbi:MAG: T9SS type A sorting domain-containing protein, partial [Muribaculaceae bacterium]|nr:T9SS type A sorting domain-containing protein [Muribaculaceae bacterium]